MLRADVALVFLGLICAVLGTQDCTCVDGQTLAFNETRVVNCNLYKCETRNNVTASYLIGEPSCELMYNGESTCIADGETRHCWTCNYDEQSTTHPFSFTKKCQGDGDTCVDLGAVVSYRCGTALCNADTAKMEIQEAGCSLTVNGEDTCVAAGDTLHCYTCNYDPATPQTPPSFSKKCQGDGDTCVDLGAVVSYRCGTALCNAETAQLEIQEAGCTLNVGGVETCVAAGDTLHCFTCNYDPATPQNPPSFSKKCQGDDDTCVDLDAVVSYRCGTALCNAETALMEIQEAGCSLTVNGVETCVAAGDTLHCHTCNYDSANPQNPPSFSKKCQGDGDTCVDLGAVVSYQCGTALCNAETAQLEIQEAGCSLNVGGVETCVAAGDTLHCYTCNYDPATPQNPPSFSKKCQGDGDTCVDLGAVVSYRCGTALCNAETAQMEIQEAGCSLNVGGESTCVAAGDTLHCYTCNYDPATPQNPPSFSKKCQGDGDTCVDLGAVVSYRCGTALCNAETAQMEIQEAGCSLAFNGEDTCVAAGDTLHCYTCNYDPATPQNPPSFSKKCKGDGDTCVDLGAVVSYRCGTALCNAETAQMEIQEAGCTLNVGGVETCVAAGDTLHCYTCNYDPATPQNPPSISKKCQGDGDTCVDLGAVVPYRCGTGLCNAETAKMEIQEAGCTLNVGGVETCVSAGDTLHCFTCNYDPATPQIPPSFSKKCQADGDTCVDLGAVVSYQCGTALCNAETAQLEIQEAGCTLNVGGVETCVSAGDTLHCFTCNYDPATPQIPPSFSKKCQGDGDTCVDLGAVVPYHCGTGLCNAETAQMEIQEGGCTLIVGGEETCVTAGDTLHCFTCNYDPATPQIPPSFSKKCKGDGDTCVDLGAVVSYRCGTGLCNAETGQMEIQEAGCPLQVSGVETCVAAGDTLHCFTCNYDSANPQTQPYFTRKCIGDGGECVDLGATAPYKCGTGVCNGETFKMEKQENSATACSYYEMCIAPGEYEIITSGGNNFNCTCGDLPTNELTCYGAK